VLISALNLAFVAALVDAALSDLRSFRIPNRDSVILVAAFGLDAALSGPAVLGQLVLAHGGVALAVFAAGAGLFALNVWGGGDVKLLTGVALWTGFAGLSRVLLVMALVGGVLAAMVMLWRRLGWSATGRVPYGVAIAAAGLDWWWVQ
jgi:prepilin peptidase CpaA